MRSAPSAAGADARASNPATIRRAPILRPCPACPIMPAFLPSTVGHSTSSSRVRWSRRQQETSAIRVAALAKRTSKKSAEVTEPVLLAGGNPQIAKADGDAPVQAYIAAMPGWKSDVGRHLDAVIVRTVLDVCKAVKWNSPFYGVEGHGLFLSFHCFSNYVKVAFFRGASLRPVPPGASKHKDVRYLDIHKDDQFDEALFAAWVKQASQLPGERM